VVEVRFGRGAAAGQVRVDPVAAAHRLLGATLVFWESRILLRARRRGKASRVIKAAAVIALRSAQGPAMPNPTVATGRSE